MRISELFYSIQGEGHLTGRPMFFIRAQGCAVKCPIRAICDQPESLTFKGGAEHSPEALAEMAHATAGAGGWVCLTGGEPTEHDDFERLVLALGRRGLRINLQTSGLRHVTVPIDWCTVSPKAPMAALALSFAHELKIIYTGQSRDELIGYFHGFRAANYYLQPCWQDGGSNHADTLEMVYALNRAGCAFEFSAQWHKYIGVH